MGQFVEWYEVPGFTADDVWRIDDAEAMALLAAPCLSETLTEAQEGQVRAVLRQALVRWKEAGSGAVTQQTAGPFGVTLDTRTERRGLFWPSELEQLRAICAGAGPVAFEIDTTPSHAATAYAAQPDTWRPW